MNRLKQIDILRAIAVFLVMGRHLERCPPASSAFLYRLTRIAARGGWIGVDLFFVLSGFLVSGLLFREYEKYRELRIGHFLVRRGFKIYPPFWILIGFTVVMMSLHHQDFSGSALASELLFVQNYGPALWNHTWSLAVEEHFYLLLALGAFVLARRRSPRPFAVIPGVFIALALLCLILRVLNSWHSPYRHETHLYPSHLRLDSLFFGVLLSHLYHQHPTEFVARARRWRYLLMGVGVLLLVPAFYYPLESTPFIYTYGLTEFYLGSGSLLVGALGFGAPTTRFSRAVAYIGSHSYSIYLWHAAVALWGTAFVHDLLLPHQSWYIYAATYLAGSIAVGVGMAVLIEFPVLRLRDRLFPSRGRPLETGANDAMDALQGLPSTIAKCPPCPSNPTGS